MQRTLVTIALLSTLVLAAGVAHAQDDITLEHVWTAVQGMQADFLILARELCSVNDRVNDVEEVLIGLTSEPILIDGERCLIHVRDEVQAETLNN